MTATVHRLPHPDTRTLTCPHCRQRTALLGGAAFVTPIGLRRMRRCEPCGRPYTTLEAPAAYYHDTVIPVPSGTPGWVLRLCERLARAAAWVARVGA